MIDPSLVILAAVIKALRESTVVAALFPGAPAVWETPPAEGAAGDLGFPSILVGEIQIVSGERIETDDGTIDDDSEVFLTLHAFARPDDAGGEGAKPKAVRLLDAARQVLGAPDGIELEPEGTRFRLLLSEIRDTRHFTDPDDLTAHSVSTVRFETEPTEG